MGIFLPVTAKDGRRPAETSAMARSQQTSPRTERFDAMERSQGTVQDLPAGVLSMWRNSDASEAKAEITNS
ncbi:hypothetical protein ACQR0Z_10935 [Bradyrhizobium sp. HKCCYLS3077]|uniref:hypothetical protein n=1 Tax=Bradyrhizobium sp. HKCCYLS3077 TaxID=3420761 RepID=UPI003EB8C3E1